MYEVLGKAIRGSFMAVMMVWVVWKIRDSTRGLFWGPFIGSDFLSGGPDKGLRGCWKGLGAALPVGNWKIFLLGSPELTECARHAPSRREAKTQCCEAGQSPPCQRVLLSCEEATQVSGVSSQCLREA